MAQPLPPATKINYSNPMKPDALAADPDLILISQADIPVELQADLVLQDIGGTELIKLIRHNMVEGQRVSYQPIKNIAALAAEFNPNTLTGVSPTLSGLKEGFPILLSNSLLVAGSVSVSGNEIIIELDNLDNADIIELATSNPTAQKEVGPRAV